MFDSVHGSSIAVECGLERFGPNLHELKKTREFHPKVEMPNFGKGLEDLRGDL